MGYLRIRDLNHLFSSIEYHAHHFTYNINALWTTVMGNQTYADLVAIIFSSMSSAPNTVKTTFEKAQDGIKNTIEYILDSVLDVTFPRITQEEKLFLSLWQYITSAISQKPATVDLESDTWTIVVLGGLLLIAFATYTTIFHMFEVMLN